MNTSTGIALLILFLVLFLAIRYIVKEKMKGIKCIGCPQSGACGAALNGGCSATMYKDLEKLVEQSQIRSQDNLS